MFNIPLVLNKKISGNRYKMNMNKGVLLFVANKIANVKIITKNSNKFINELFLKNRK